MNDTAHHGLTGLTRRGATQSRDRSDGSGNHVQRPPITCPRSARGNGGGGNQGRGSYFAPGPVGGGGRATRASPRMRSKSRNRRLSGAGYALAKQDGLGRVKNRAGNCVGPSLERPGSRCSADGPKAEDFYLVIPKRQGPNSWPSAASSFVRICTTAEGRRTAARPVSLQNGLREGPGAAGDGYVELPIRLGKQIEAYWASTIK